MLRRLPVAAAGYELGPNPGLQLGDDGALIGRHKLSPEEKETGIGPQPDYALAVARSRAEDVACRRSANSSEFRYTCTGANTARRTSMRSIELRRIWRQARDHEPLDTIEPLG
jgi:hypothetical protein